VRVPREEIYANTTKAQSSDLTIGTIKSSTTTHTTTEANVPSLVDEKYFSNVSQVKSMRMIEIPKPKKMLLPIFDIDATNDYEKSTKDNFALKKIIKTLKEETKSLSTQNDESIIIDPTPPTLDAMNDDASKQSLPELPIFSNSKLNTNSLSRSRSNDNEDASASVRSKLRLADGSIPGVVKVRMQNTSVIEGGATRLIYSVHLDDKPVPAETAARDMALLSPQEVALELGAPVIIQSERK